MNKYLQSCKTEFWKKVFVAELDYILNQLKGAKDVLSIGCGPAIIEAGLAEHGFNITGLDISKEALDQAPDSIRTVVSSAENMDFKNCSFDAVIYVASLQFIEKYQEALKQTARVLKPAGRILAMLINPKSGFFKERAMNPTSYINKIKHIDLKEVERTIAEYFTVKTEYFLGIREHDVFETSKPRLAALYVIRGKRNDRYEEKLN